MVGTISLARTIPDNSTSDALLHIARSTVKKLLELDQLTPMAGEAIVQTNE
jgi:hypothetical protein